MSNPINHNDRTILDNDRIDDDPLHATREQAERDRLVSTDGHIIAPEEPREGARVVATDDHIAHGHDDIDRHEVKHMSHETKEELNADIITGEPGSHPIGTGIGGVGGAAAGAAIGSMAGPLGTLIGGAIGAVVGGGAGHAAAEAIDPTHEEAYWRAEHANVSYYQQGYEFDRDMHPAYAVGYANRARYPADARFEDHEADLKRSWEEVKGDSRMAWDEARLASRDAWNRVS